MPRRVLTMDRANKILNLYKPEAVITKGTNNKQYYITYSKNGRKHTLTYRMNLYDILLNVVGYVIELEDYRELYRPVKINPYLKY